MIARWFSLCWLAHSPEWTLIRVNGQLTRSCSRCQQPLKPILARNGSAEDIIPAKIPAIVERHAYPTPKPKRARKRVVKPYEVKRA